MILSQTRTQVWWGVATALFWVLFLWGFWQKDVYALGINAFVYLAGTTALFLWTMRQKGIVLKEHLFWIIPLNLIAISFALYDNPFLKTVSVFLYPVLFAVFYNYSFLSEKLKVFWDATFIGKMFVRLFGIFGWMYESFCLHADILNASSEKRSTLKRVLLGLVIFLVIASVIIIPLLSSADLVFAASMRVVTAWLTKFISPTVVYKLVFWAFLSVGTVAGVLAWSKSFVIVEKTVEEKRIDPLVTGIVLTGILALYFFFLLLQIQQLWIGQLPFTFAQTEQLVKSGFWQLLFLSVINIGIYFLLYRKTIPVVQKILGVFVVSSLLLVFSAAHRVWLYVTNYGLSYEKFFASYTVVFCVILFVWLLTRLCVSRRSDVCKFLVVLFLWMYAGLTIFPVEQFVFRANVALLQKKDSRIRLYELSMLSPDVLTLVKSYQQDGKLIEKNAPTAPFDWGKWIRVQDERVKSKAWYEKNLMNILLK